MEIKFFWAILSSIIAIVLFIPYFIDIFKHKTQPHMYSWLIWGLLQLIGMAAAFKGGAGYGTWALFIGSFFCLAIFALSFKYGTKNIKRVDVYCLVGAFVALCFYLFISNPLYSAILVALIDFIAFIPTFRKGYEEPYTETMSAYSLSALANVLSLLALQYYSVTTALYLVTLFITNSTICIILITRRRKLKANQV